MEDITPEDSVVPVYRVELTEEELAALEELENSAFERATQAVAFQRQVAYQNEADPIFFKSQRGEATNQEWLDKIAEIDARFPYPVDDSGE